MLKQNPYVGQTVLFKSNPDDKIAKSNDNDDYIPAIITRVWSEGVVNLKIIPDCGPMQDRTSVAILEMNPAGYHFKFIPPINATYLSEEAALVSFGNYLLSKIRADRTSEQGKEGVNDSDLANWKDEYGIVGGLKLKLD